VKAEQAERARAWAKQWAGAAKALADERRASLAALTESEAAAASVALLDLGASLPPDPARRATSGFVEQQALFHRRGTR
jgi:hypothetical protein